MASSSSPGSSTNGSANGSTGRSVARATVGVGLMHFLRFAIGFLTQPLFAHAFGLGSSAVGPKVAYADVNAVATEIIQRLWLIWEKVVNPAFLPAFIGALKEDGEERAWKFASTAAMLTGLSLLIVTPLAWVFMPQIVGIYSQKAGPEQQALTVHMARWMLPALFLLGFSSLTYTILNGYKRFVVAALGDTLWKFGLFAAAVWITLRHLKPEAALPVIIVGYVIGALFKLVPHILAIGDKWKYLRPRIDMADPLTRTMISLALPLILGIIVSESRGVYLSRLADAPEISVDAGRAALKWARNISDTFIQIFPYALSIGIFPYLADLARERDKQPLTDTLMGALRVCFFFFGPLTLILIAISFPLLRAVWESGNFTQQDTLAINLPFIGFTLGLLAAAFEMQLNQTFYAMKRAWLPTASGIGVTVLWVIIATLGVRNGGGLFAIALAESVSKSLKCLIMWFLLRPYLGDTKPRENTRFVLQVLGAAVVAAGVAWALCAVLVPLLAGHAEHAAPSKVKMLLAVGTSGLGALVTFTMLASVMKIREAQQLLSVGQKLKRRQ